LQPKEATQHQPCCLEKMNIFMRRTDRVHARRDDDGKVGRGIPIRGGDDVHLYEYVWVG
jgi:hypothetical protein